MKPRGVRMIWNADALSEQTQDLLHQLGRRPDLMLVADEQLPLPTIEEAEEYLVERALERTQGNRTRAAKLLGITVRTVRNKLRLPALAHAR